VTTPIACAPPPPAPVTERPSGSPAGHAGTARWIAAGVRRRGTAAAVTLVCAWSGVWLAVWLLVADTLVGALLSALGYSISAALVGSSGTSPGGAALSVAGGALRGAAAGLVSSVVSLVVDEPLQFLAALCGGLLVSLALFAAGVALEPWLLRLHGFRRMSRREAARVMPLLETEAADLGLTSLPLVLMADGDDLRVRAHARHLIVGRSLLDEIGDEAAGDAGLDAVLCHGLQHWAAGDGVGDLMVRCCGLPLVILYNAGCRLAQQGNGLIALVGWVVLWPAWLLVRLIIQPIVAVTSRRQEYAADAAVAATGRGAALHGALSLLGELEPGRSGWDRVMAATHPPRELRLEALEPEAER
jgi:hypothetical protein